MEFILSFFSIFISLYFIFLSLVSLNTAGPIFTNYGGDVPDLGKVGLKQVPHNKVAKGHKFRQSF